MSLRGSILLAAAVLVLLAGVVATAVTYTRNRTWRQGEARVVSNAVQRYETSAGRMYRPSATFRLAVDGEAFLIPRSFDSAFGSEQEARDVANRYSPNSVHSVLFNPDNRYHMVLDSSELAINLRWPVATLAMGVALSALAMFRSWRANRALCPKCAEGVELWDKFCWSCSAKLPKRRKRVHKVIS